MPNRFLRLDRAPKPTMTLAERSWRIGYQDARERRASAPMPGLDQSAYAAGYCEGSAIHDLEHSEATP